MNLIASRGGSSLLEESNYTNSKGCMPCPNKKSVMLPLHLDDLLKMTGQRLKSCEGVEKAHSLGSMGKKMTNSSLNLAHHPSQNYNISFYNPC